RSAAARFRPRSSRRRSTPCRSREPDIRRPPHETGGMAGTSGAERPFVGRPESGVALRRRSDAVRFGRGGLTVIEGEAGVGKSTLIDGIVREVRAKGLQVLMARARSLENPPPLLLL